MKFVKINFPKTIFSSEGKRNSFYEDALPGERIKAVGMLLAPVFSEGSEEETTGV